MAITDKSRRLFHLKQRFLKTVESNRTFGNDFDTLSELFSIKSLSIPNCRWCTKALVEMRQRYSAVDHGHLLDHLQDKLDRAFQRSKDRAAGREEKKKNPPGRKPMVTLPALPKLNDVWGET
jgi:hypothetical protein